MSQVKIQGNASGTGIFTVAAPNSNTDRTLTLPDGAGTLVRDDGSGKLLKAQMPTGSVLQVVQTVLTSTASVSGSTWNEVTSLATSITPSSASSKILIMPSVDYSTDVGYRAGFRIVRNSTDILLGDAAGSRIRASQLGRFFDASSQMTSQANRIYLDSPSTTSSVTYKFYLSAENATGATLYLNRTWSDSDSTSHFRGTSTIILMEIAG